MAQGSKWLVLGSGAVCSGPSRKKALVGYQSVNNDHLDKTHVSLWHSVSPKISSEVVSPSWLPGIISLTPQSLGTNPSSVPISPPNGLDLT